MTVAEAVRRPTAAIGSLGAHLRSPATRSGYALLLSSLITSVLGLGYWVLAARLYDKVSLGIGAALVSAMLLVTSLATAGLKRGLIRFVPTSGSGARRLVGRVYAGGLAVCVVLGVGFLVGFHTWSNELGVLRQGWWAPLVFLAGVTLWGVFVLQDSVLIGIDRATLVPGSNAIFSVLKIVVLVIAASVVGKQWGVFASWLVPGLIVSLLVSGWLFRRGLDAVPDRPGQSEVSLRAVVHFTGIEYVATLLWQAAIYLTPLLVLVQAGATANSHYYLASQIAYALFLVSSNVTDAFVAAASADGRDLGGQLRRTCTQISLLLIPGVVVMVAAAPQIMAVFGADYRGDGATVLRLLALAAVPNALSTVAVALAHIRRRMMSVLIIQASMATLTVGISYALIGGHGVAGVAAGWLIAQTLTAALSVVVLLRTERSTTRRLGTASVAAASRWRTRLARRRCLAAVDTRLALIPQELLPHGPVSLLGCQHDLIVVAVGAGSRRLIVRLADGRLGSHTLATHRTQLTRLADDPRLSDLRDLIPRVIHTDPAGRWTIETASEGRGRRQLLGSDRVDRAMSSSVKALEILHRATAHQEVLDEGTVDRLVHDRVAQLATVVTDDAGIAGLYALRHRLTMELEALPASMSLVHGDASLDNILTTPDGDEVVGIVDWEQSEEGLPECDLIALALAHRMVRGGELGAHVVDLLENGWSADERDRLGPTWSVNAHVRPTTLVLLTWLGHVHHNLAKTDRYRTNQWWIRANVTQVLGWLADHEDLVNPPSSFNPPTDREPSETQPELHWTGSSYGSAAPTASRSWFQRARPIRQAIGACAVLSLLSTWAGAPIALRMTTTLLAVIAGPTLALGTRLRRRLGGDRWIVAATGAVALAVLLAEVQLYTDTWSPPLLAAVLAAVAVLTVAPDRSPSRTVDPPKRSTVIRARSKVS